MVIALMLEVLQFIFSSFWVWLGMVVLVMAVTSTITAVVQAFHK